MNMDFNYFFNLIFGDITTLCNYPYTPCCSPRRCVRSSYLYLYLRMFWFRFSACAGEGCFCGVKWSLQVFDRTIMAVIWYLSSARVARPHTNPACRRYPWLRKVVNKNQCYSIIDVRLNELVIWILKPAAWKCFIPGEIVEHHSSVASPRPLSSDLPR